MAGRPRLAQRVTHIHIHLRLYEEQDEDLLAVFQKVPRRKLSSFLKVALRSGNALGINPDSLPDDENLSQESVETFLH
jgi:hypothetical protein